MSKIILEALQQKPLNNKQESVLYLKVIPANQVQTDTKMLANLLNAVNFSFESFVQAELISRNSTIKPALKKENNLFVAECRLLVQNIQVNDFTIVLQINTSEENRYKAIKNVPELKQELFDLFVNTVFSPDLFTADFIKILSERYSAKERISIFKTIIELVDQQSFHLSFGTAAATVNHDWPGKNDPVLRSSLIPEAIKSPKEQVETYYQYIKTGEENDLFGKRSRYEKVLIKENPKHDLYPYQLQKITVKGKKYTFNKQLSATVFVKNNFYEIGLPELLLNVKHETRSGAEKAFDAALATLIVQLEKEQAQKSPNVIKLKELLNEH